MPDKIFTPSLVLSLSLTLLMIGLSLLGTYAESLLEFNREKILAGEYWRLLSSNLVHYGFAHLMMNAAALLLIGGSLLRELSVRAYLSLLLLTGLAVTLATLSFNLELSFYRGFSGALHGLLVVGLLLNRLRNPWLSYLGVALVFGKIIHEHQADFQANQLQELLPVAVAVDSHMYGAIAGLVFFAVTWMLESVRKS